jgi:hypothetical protein
MSNHHKQRDWKRGGSRNTQVSRYRKVRPKSFTNEESAKAYAKANGITKFRLKNLKSPDAKVKKLVIVEE